MTHTRKRKFSTLRLRQSLFWDSDPRIINLDTHKRYVIERILDFGSEKDVQWLLHYYPKTEIKKVVSSSRSLHKKSAHYWSFILRIPLAHIRCLQIASHKKRNAYSRS